MYCFIPVLIITLFRLYSPLTIIELTRTIVFQLDIYSVPTSIFFPSMESLFIKQKVFRHNRFIGSLYFLSFNLNKADVSAIFLIGREIIN